MEGENNYPFQSPSYRCRNCFAASVAVASPAESIELLDSTIFALDIRCKAISYRCKEHLLRARQYHTDGDPIRCKAELQERFQLSQTYQRYVNLHSNVRRVRDSIDEASAIGTIAGSMHVANRALEHALRSVDPEKIEALMAQLDEGTHQMHEIGGLLGEQRGVEEFDEEEAMRDLGIPTTPESRSDARVEGIPTQAVLPLQLARTTPMAMLL